MKANRIGVILVYAIAGGLTGFFGVWLIDGLIEVDNETSIPLLLLGALFVILGVASLAMTANRRTVAAAMNVELEDDNFAPERRLLVLQGGVLIVSGAAMLLPALGRAPLGLNGETAFAIVLALLLAESVVNWRIWQSSDELMRRMMGEICAVAFWAFQLILFVWAVAVQFGIIARFDPLLVVALMMGIYIIAASVVGARRFGG